jgi:hypothetical protein
VPDPVPLTRLPPRTLYSDIPPSERTKTEQACYDMTSPDKEERISGIRAAQWRMVMHGLDKMSLMHNSNLSGPPSRSQAAARAGGRSGRFGGSLPDPARPHCPAHLPEVIERARRSRVLALDLPARAFNPLDRPFLALDHIMTSKIAGVFMDLGFPAGGPNNFGTMTEKVMGPILHSMLKGDLRELIRHLILVDLQSQLDKQGEQIRRACVDLQSLLPQ